MHRPNFNVKTNTYQPTKNMVKGFTNFQPKVYEYSTKIIPVLPLLHQSELTCVLWGTVMLIGDNDIQKWKVIRQESNTSFCILKQGW